ncbi:SGNH/GDSL hydrolase family protein [Pseudonocardia sp. ICBG1293]|uniref:SGNH/GDSL hydrolase family protein n=1 Tax=Pseudonocardia sp. ICBG1293 TaxID=2844382 RepID=UPI001CCD5D47|nr:SGNH/GDSL hydrolase family protein [Pseudonocardia sp. ICBG1293]
MTVSRRILGVILAGVVTVAGLSGLAAADQPEDTAVPAVDDPGVVRVMPLGASSTVGVGSPATAGYRLPLWQRLAADGVHIDYVGSRSSGPDTLPDTDHEGRSGWTAARMVPMAGGWVLAAQPDVVLLHAGTNDLLQGAGARATAASLDRLLDRVFAAAPHTHVIMAGVWAPLPKQRAERARLADYLPRVAAAHRAAGHSVEYVDTSTLFPAGRTADGLHAGPGAYRTIATVWADRIEAHLGVRPATGRR